MEATVLSVGKSVVNGALSYAKSALAEEVALQLGVQRDQAFIRDELEMMQSFLMAAHDERDEHKVIKTWVKQVRDVAYDVEDCLQDFAVRLEKQSWWRNPRTLRDRRRVAKRMKDLRAKVEDVSQRNVRYRIFQGSSGSKPTNAADQSSSSASATMFGIDEARRAAKLDKQKVDLVELINKEDKDLRVIAVWGTSGDLGQTSIIKSAYDDPKICQKFECRAWIRLMHPFDPTEFMQSIMSQFYANSFLKAGNIQEKATLRAQVLKNMGMIKREYLIDKFINHVDKKSSLIVINGLLTIEDWDRLKMYFLKNKNGSRIIVSTEKVEVASLCAGQESQVSELKQLSADQTLYVFYEKDSQGGMDSTKPPGSSSNSSITSTNNSSTVPIGEILEEQSELVGRGKEKSEIIALISKDSQQVEVISVCGMGGLGKTTLVKDIYQSQELNGMFKKRAYVTAMRPFSREELLRSLVMQLGADTSEKDVLGTLGSTKKTSALNMGLEDLLKELSKLLEKNRCLIVLDDLSSTAEWDLIITGFPEMENTSRIIVTTREENIAKHCSKKQENIYKLEGLQYKDALGLFTKKAGQQQSGRSNYILLLQHGSLYVKNRT